MQHLRNLFSKNSTRLLVISCFLFSFVLLTFNTLEARICPFCGVHVGDQDLLCPGCLRAIAWPTYPPRTHAGRVIVRTGCDSFIRSPNDQHPKQRWYQNAGQDRTGPLGSWATPTGFRYLLRFDIPQAFELAGISMEDFHLNRAMLILRLAPTPDAYDRVPLIVYPLNRPFIAGKGIWGQHEGTDAGCTWFQAMDHLPWLEPGGDFNRNVLAHGFLPASGRAEIQIDITPIVALRFHDFRETGKWFDPGIIIMRNPTVNSRCRYRNVYGFETAPVRASPTAHTPPKVLSPELYLK